MAMVAEQTTKQVIYSGDLKLEQMTKSVFLNDQPIELKGLNYRFLEALLLSNNKLLSYEDLAQQVWGNAAVSEETIAQRASLLRKAISDSEKRYFEAVRGRGYQWLKAIRFEVFNDAANAVELNTETGLKSHKASYKASFMLSAVCIVAVLVFAFSQLNNKAVDNGESQPLVEHQSAPLILQKADEFAAQHTQEGNKIALELYKKYLDEHSASAPVLFAYAQALIERAAKFEQHGQHLAEAALVISQLAQLETHSLALWWLKGYYADVMGEIDNAIAHYEKSLTLQETPMQRTAGSLAYLYTQRGRLYEATQLNLTALQGRGQYRLLQLAEIFYLLDLNPHASEWSNAAYLIAPNDGFISVHYAKTRLSNQHYDEAKAVINKLHQLGVETEDSYRLLAQLAIIDKNWQDAAHWLEQGLMLAPDSIYLQSMNYWLMISKLNKPAKLTSTIDGTNAIWPNAIVAASIIPITDGDKDGAMALLNKAFQLGFLDYRALLQNPIFEPLHAMREFQTLLENMQQVVQTERAKVSLIQLPDLTQLMLAK